MREIFKARGWRILAAIVAMVLAAMPVAADAAGTDRVFTIANYPVDATAKNALAAKRKAIADGQSRAFRSLLKRLVPVTAYAALDKLKTVDARGYLASVAVRSEGEPTRRYIASLDYAFIPDRVRGLLRQNGVPFVDTQAPAATLVVVYRAPGGQSAPADLAQAAGANLWQSIWRDLDLKNALAPLVVRAVSPRIRPDVIDGAAAGDENALRILSAEHGGAQTGERVLIALATPDLAKRRLVITFAGRDAVGAMALKRVYRVFDGDWAYAMELAAVVGQGILEGRWKVIKAGTPAGGTAVATGQLEAVQVWVTYQSFAQWRSIRQIFFETPGVTDFRIGGQSARSASLALRFPGGGAALSRALSARGLSLVEENGFWVLR